MVYKPAVQALMIKTSKLGERSGLRRMTTVVRADVRDTAFGWGRGAKGEAVSCRLSQGLPLTLISRRDPARGELMGLVRMGSHSKPAFLPPPEPFEHQEHFGIEHAMALSEREDIEATMIQRGTP